MKLPSLGKFRGIVIFILLAGIVTVTSLTIYATVQQSYRMGANDPQIEAVQTISRFLNQGVTPDQITGQGETVDMANSLSLFIIIFDKDGKVESSSGSLGDSTPTPPSGIFDYLRAHNQQRFTWEPQKGVRVAAVAQKLDNDKGFLLVARNLKEVEAREKNLTITVGIAWIILLVLSALLTLVLAGMNKTTAIIEQTEIINVTEKPEEEIQL